MRYYEIVIKGHIDNRRVAWFEGLNTTQLPRGETLVAGEVLDQAALHCILNRIRDMGLQLISVRMKG